MKMQAMRVVLTSLLLVAMVGLLLKGPTPEKQAMLRSEDSPVPRRGLQTSIVVFELADTPDDDGMQETDSELGDDDIVELPATNETYALNITLNTTNTSSAVTNEAADLDATLDTTSVPWADTIDSDALNNILNIMIAPPSSPRPSPVSSAEPTRAQSAAPSLKPTIEPTNTPSALSAAPSLEPTIGPTNTPSASPPSPEPSAEPTSAPSTAPSLEPTIEPFGELTYVGNDATGFYAPYPLGVCQGDCDDDDDCGPGLYCFQRNSNMETPGCSGGNRYAGVADFCVWNTSYPTKPEEPEVYNFGTVTYVGNDGTWYSPYPLPVCRGDCDTDDDCAEGLFCYARDPYELVPGCLGEDSTSADVCVWNTSFPMPEPSPIPPVEAFRLKLYWEEGYRWQNETIEREWCVMHDFDGYPGTGGCWYEREFKNCSSNQLYMGLCIDDEPRQWFTFDALGDSYNGDQVDEVLIKTRGPGPERCFARRDSAIHLDPNCDPNDNRQRFFALRGDLTGYRFELGQYTGYTLANCVTNAHHPKSGEVLEFHICEEARKLHDETSFWEFLDP